VNCHHPARHREADRWAWTLGHLNEVSRRFVKCLGSHQLHDVIRRPDDDVPAISDFSAHFADGIEGRTPAASNN